MDQSRTLLFRDGSSIQILFCNLQEQQVLSERDDKTVYLEADKAVPYGQVVQVMAAVKRAGVVKLGMVAMEPEK